MPPKCPVCSREFSDAAMANHLVVAHPSYQTPEVLSQRPVPHRCVFCGATFDRPEALRDHHLSAHGK